LIERLIIPVHVPSAFPWVERGTRERLDDVRSGLERTRLGRRALVLALAFSACAGCDPLVDVAGAFFPAWMLCILAGIAATVCVRYAFSRARLEPWLGPLLLVYPSLSALIALALWLALYRSP
jgi:hypothetical protein